MQWKDLMPMPSLVTMLEKCFFPKWIEILVSLLNLINPKYEEMIIWYKTWKTYFPPDIAQHPAIKGFYLLLYFKN